MTDVGARGPAVRLSPGTLDDLPADVARPAYDRSRVTVGIVHIGVGGFHRAHQALYLDELLEDGALEWGVCGVGLLPVDARMASVLHASDGLYTVVEKHPDGTLHARVVGSIVRYLYAPDDPDAVVEQLADPAVRIVSLTITEGGYALDSATGRLDADDPEVARDLKGQDAPRTVFGLVAEGLRRRRERGLPGVTIMSCDNIEGNGHVAEQTFSTFLELVDPDLAAWAADHVRFPSSMVDRITPVTTDDDRALVRRELGVDDDWPVVCEPFRQWVLEDDFVNGRPEFERVGVQVVPDVRPYELMKLRLLNAGHQTLGYLGYLCGHRLVHEASSDPDFVRLLLDYMRIEGRPTLEPVPGIDLDAYCEHLVERFANPYVRDTIARLCAYSSDRMPKWVLPVIRAQLAMDGPIDRATAVVAAWARYAEGVDEDGEPIEVVDRLADDLRRRALLGGTAFLENRALFGELGDDERFRDAYLKTFTALHERGARAVVEDLLRLP